MNEDWLHDKNGTAYDRQGKAYDKEGNVIPPMHSALDQGIARAVCILQAKGVDTIESCEGGEGHCFDHPTIRFSGTQRCGMYALGIAIKLCWPVRSLRRCWRVIENEVDGPEWELEFHELPDPATVSTRALK